MTRCAEVSVHPRPGPQPGPSYDGRDSAAPSSFTPNLGHTSRLIGTRPLQGIGRPRTESGLLPLKGVSVPVRTTFAAPYGATLLTDLGARVIKVEPLVGTSSATCFHFRDRGAKVIQGKNSTASIPPLPRGSQSFTASAAGCDSAPGVAPGRAAEQHRFDAETLMTLNPDLVYLHTAGIVLGRHTGIGRRSHPASAPRRVSAGPMSATASGTPGLGIDMVQEAAVRMLVRRR